MPDRAVRAAKLSDQHLRSSPALLGISGQLRPKVLNRPQKYYDI